MKTDLERRLRTIMMMNRSHRRRADRVAYPVSWVMNVCGASLLRPTPTLGPTPTTARRVRRRSRHRRVAWCPPRDVCVAWWCHGGVMVVSWSCPPRDVAAWQRFAVVWYGGSRHAFLLPSRRAARAPPSLTTTTARDEAVTTDADETVARRWWRSDGRRAVWGGREGQRTTETTT